MSPSSVAKPFNTADAPHCRHQMFGIPKMASRAFQANSVGAAIREVLVRDWDPIGVMDDPDWPRDEYDSYIGELHGFLARGESAEFIARHLCFIEEKFMGYGATRVSARMSVAEKLKAIIV